MTYLFTDNQEIKNDEGNPIPISKDTTVNSSSNPIHVSISSDNMPEVEIKNDTGNPLPISKNTTVNSNTNPIFVQGTSDTTFFDPMQSDAFGRLRVSQPFTLFDSQHRYQDNDKVDTYTSGTATATHDANSSTIELEIGTASGDKVYRESSRVFAYQPGKSLQIFKTFCMSPAKTNLRQRVGYFNEDNGVFLERDGSTVSLVLRSSSAGGSPVERRVNQANWNINTLSELDLDRVQILFIDIEWLGVGSVRCGFVIDGIFKHCHTFHNANTEISSGVPLTTTYMTTAILPVRTEFENTGETESSSTYKIICTTVISEGGYTLHGRPLSVGHQINAGYALTTANTLYPIFSMRLKSSRLDGLVLPKNFSVAVTGNVNYRYVILLGGTTSGGTWTDAGASNSSVEYKLNATSVSGGTTYEVGYIINTNQSSNAPLVAATPFQYQLERNIFTSTATEFTIAIMSSGTNNTAWASVNWEEMT